MKNDTHPPKETSARRGPGRRPLAQGSAEDTRREIRWHALRLFNERGYVSVSVDDIAQGAGVTRATLYYHFKSKADIFVECVVTTAERAHADVEPLAQQQDLSVRERLTRMARYRREILERPADGQTAGEFVSEVMVQEALPHLKARQQARMLEAFARSGTMTCDLIAEGVARGEFRPLPPEMLAHAFWQLFQPADYPAGHDRAEVEAVLLDLFFHGVSA